MAGGSQTKLESERRKRGRIVGSEPLIISNSFGELEGEVAAFEGLQENGLGE